MRPRKHALCLAPYSQSGRPHLTKLFDMPPAAAAAVVGLALASLAAPTAAFHDCIQPKSQLRLPPALRGGQPPAAGHDDADSCSGGLCVGMHGGPHEGGPASYPVSDRKGGFTSVSSTMTVPKMPEK